MRLSLLLTSLVKVRSISFQEFIHLNVAIPFRLQLVPEPNNLRAGGHREAVIPVPIPNTEVKGFIAEGSVGPAHARVGRRRPFFIQKKARRRPFVRSA